VMVLGKNVRIVELGFVVSYIQTSDLDPDECGMFIYLSAMLISTSPSACHPPLSIVLNPQPQVLESQFCDPDILTTNDDNTFRPFSGVLQLLHLHTA